jgi:hypothetical protein
MEKHKFVTGDRVRVAKKLAYSAAEPGIYTIVRVLPVAGFGLQYRARKDEETQEYVLNEEGGSEDGGRRDLIAGRIPERIERRS